MIIQLTAAGQALLEASTGPVIITSFQLGSGFNYIPQASDTALHGTLIYTGTPTQPLAVSGNIVKYSGYLDYPLGPFSFGEMGLFVGTTLFALAANQVLIPKVALTSTSVGNAIRLDSYVSVVGTNYEMFLDLAETSNSFRVAVLGSVDQLPQPQNATPNVYTISGATSQQSAFFAYTDRAGLWSFDAYAYANQAQATVVGFDSQSVTIAIADYVPGMSPAYFGAAILEFSTGALYGLCRYIQTAVISGGNVTLGFASPLAIQPVVGDKFIVFGRQALSTTIPNLPIASHTVLGAVIVGTTLTVTNTGLLNVDPTAFPVTSVNGQTGDVVLTASDISGLAAVAISGDYNDLINRPAVYSLPIATTSTLGGVKAPTDGNLTVAGDGTIDLGFAPVKTVNGVAPDGTGNINVTSSIIGLVGPQAIPNAADLNTYQLPGLFFVTAANAASLLNAPSGLTEESTLEVVPATLGTAAGDVVQRLTGIDGATFVRGLNGATWNPWVKYQTNNTLAIATTTTLGGVIVGAGLNITGTGTLSTQIQSVNGQTNQFVTLSASDVGAIATTELNVQGGVPSLDLNTGTANPATDPYTYGRSFFYTNTLGVLEFAGTWNATTNHLVQAHTGSAVSDTNTALLATGQQTIDISYNGAGAPATLTSVPNYQTVSAEGQMYLVTTAGTTNLDGNALWNVGDVAFALNGVWHRLALATPFPIVFFAPSTYTASQVINEIPIPFPVSFPAGSAGAYAKNQATATASATIVIGHRAGLTGAITNVGTIVFTAGSVTGTISITAAFVAAAGDTIVFTGPASADATLAGVSASILGNR
jgi:hypothetical protein